MPHVLSKVLGRILKVGVQNFKQGVQGQGLTLAMCPLARMHFLGGRASSGHNN